MKAWILTFLLSISISGIVHANADYLNLVKSVNFPLDKYLKGRPITGLKEAKIMVNVPLVDKTTYYLTGKLRLLNNPANVPFVPVHSYYRTKFKTGGVKLQNIGKEMMVNTASGWIEFGGDFTALEGTRNVDFLISVYGYKLNVEVDPRSVQMQTLTVDSDWKKKANARINQIRKGNLNMKFKTNNKYETSKLKFHLEQTRAAFPFGSAVNDFRLNSQNKVSVKYREQLTKYFTWGTPANELKWAYSEPYEGVPSFGPGDRAIAGLEKLDMKVRGHSLAWSKRSRIPRWLVNKSPAKIKETIKRRWSYVAKRWGNRIAQWDVNNENLHGQWYSKKLNDTNLMPWMFNEFHKLVPNAQLFINDFQVLTSSSYNLACKHQVEKLIKTGAPLGGIGLQAHFWKRSSIASYMKRMSVLGETGIPIWLTEFDIRFGTDDEKVALLDDILRLTFSLPYVEGIIFWSVWDGHAERGAPTFMTGDNFQLTKMGRKFDDLLLKEWRTHETFDLSSGLSVNKKVFYGQYKLTATYEKSTLWTKDIELLNSNNGVVHINI